MQPSWKSLSTQVFQGFESLTLRHYIPWGDWDVADLMDRRWTGSWARIERFLQATFGFGASADDVTPRMVLRHPSERTVNLSRGWPLCGSVRAGDAGVQRWKI